MRSTLCANREEAPINHSLELLYIKVKGSPSKECSVWNRVSTPQSPCFIREDLDKAVEDSLVTSRHVPLVLVGDFSIVVLSRDPVQLPHLEYVFHNHWLSNMVHDVTRIRTNGSQTSFDLLLAEDGIITLCPVILMGISDHLPVLTAVPLAARAAVECSTIRICRHFRKSNMHEICQALASSGLKVAHTLCARIV